jgi:hypothetical protein
MRCQACGLEDSGPRRIRGGKIVCDVCAGVAPHGVMEDSERRLRETIALSRIATALGVRLDPDKDNVLLLEELAIAAEGAQAVESTNSQELRDLVAIWKKTAEQDRYCDLLYCISELEERIGK